MGTKNKTPKEWARDIWNCDDGPGIYIDDAPAELRADVARELAEIHERNARMVQALSAPYEARTVNGVLYRTKAEADMVRHILSAAGCPNDNPSTPRARRALSDAGRYADYIDAIEGEVRDIGSFDPLDIGFDPRATQMPVSVPDAPANGLLRATLPRSRKYPAGKIIYGSRGQICDQLRRSGFRIAD